MGSLADIQPEDYHPDVLEKVLSHPATFTQLGKLDTQQLYSEKFDKTIFDKENELDLQAMPSIRNCCQA